ncbi:hypothetical protein Hanom_Chr00s153663g01822901 [Helianthus anomalus]|nr:hypothetical protein HanOQP8_Chr13g0506621 [Helianthus annuus]
MDSIEKGIVEFILQHNVRRLVMGGAADKHYSKKMVDLKSKKAIYVRLLAHPSCQIQFICKGNLIFTRYAVLSILVCCMLYACTYMYTQKIPSSKRTRG